MKIDIRIETNAIDKFERRNFSKNKEQIVLWSHLKKIGIVPIKIDLNKLSLINFQKFILIPHKIKNIFLKYQTIAKTLPN